MTCQICEESQAVGDDAPATTDFDLVLSYTNIFVSGEAHPRLHWKGQICERCVRRLQGFLDKELGDYKRLADRLVLKLKKLREENTRLKKIFEDEHGAPETVLECEDTWDALQQKVKALIDGLKQQTARLVDADELHLADESTIRNLERRLEEIISGNKPKERCVICGKNWVDVAGGYDTCEKCLGA